MSELNGVMMQYFQWYLPDNGNLWHQVADRAGELAEAGITGLWLPPATKGIGGGSDVGYGVYDLYDLGEFDQKGSVRTKYGTKGQYLQAVQAVRKAGIQVYADAVLNHRMGGDTAENCRATPYRRVDRLHPAGEQREISAYTAFTFPGRAGAYSSFTWSWRHFDAVDYDERHPQGRDTVYLLEGKQFDDQVSLEFGNFAYLMGCDLDCQHPEVREELIRWGTWYLDTVGVDGFRLDAIKHIASWFFPEWIDALERHAGRDLFVVGEYWVNSVTHLLRYIDDVGGRMAVFDVPLHYNFHRASRAGGEFDMRRILDGSIMQTRPTHAVTFVENHDSQPLQALESVVEPWFKPLAYSLILLRREGYPCLFYADYYGAEYEDYGRDGNRYQIFMPSHRPLLDCLLRARRLFAYGPQYDYFDHPHTIGWTRLGDTDHPGGMAVLLSNGSAGRKWMEVGAPNTVYEDCTGHLPELITTNEHGWGEFCCQGGAVSVWVPRSRE
ncbi:MAG: alpha-amylase [Geobacter sp.]|jgi:alpha-amylase|nr:alpha-amylase [Geobacter sp.]